MQSVDCPCCGSSSSSPWAQEAGFTVVRCAECRLLYVNPRPGGDYIDKAVRTGIHSQGAGPTNVRSRRVPQKVGAYGKRMKHVIGDILDDGKPVRWVDVGSGYGEFIEALRAILPPGSEVSGVEPMQHKAEAARARGLAVHNGYLAPEQFKADVISNMDVFSHIPDYRSFLQVVATNLAPGGQMIIETGNAADLEHCDEAPNELGLPDHLVFAGREQMRRYLDSAGFELRSIYEERFDTATQMAKNAMKKFLRCPTRVRIPYTSAYRQIILRATLIRP